MDLSPIMNSSPTTDLRQRVDGGQGGREAGRGKDRQGSSVEGRQRGRQRQRQGSRVEGRHGGGEEGRHPEWKAGRQAGMEGGRGTEEERNEGMTEWRAGSRGEEVGR